MTGPEAGLKIMERHAGPHLHLASHWGPDRRQLRLAATLRLEGGAGGTPSQDALAFLSRLGEHERLDEIYLFSADEVARLDRARAEADSLVASFEASLEDWAAGLELPHDLDREAPRASTSRGRIACRVLEAGGWTYLPERSGRGAYALRRNNARNHTLGLSMDINDWHASALADLHLAGPGWYYGVSLPFTSTAFEVVAGDAQRWEKLLENLAAAARVAERDLFEPISRLFPPAPEGWSG